MRLTRVIYVFGIIATVSCREETPARTERYSRRNVELLSAVPDTGFTVGIFEHRVRVEVPAEEPGTAVRVWIRVRNISGDSAQLVVPACSMDMRLYLVRGSSRRRVYSWRRDRPCAPAGSLYFLKAGDTLPFHPTLSGYEIPQYVRGGRYELAVTLPGVDPEREISVAVVRLGRA